MSSRLVQQLWIHEVDVYLEHQRVVALSDLVAKFKRLEQIYSMTPPISTEANTFTRSESHQAAHVVVCSICRAGREHELPLIALDVPEKRDEMDDSDGLVRAHVEQAIPARLSSRTHLG